MNLNQLQPKTKRKTKRYIGHGGKKGTTSGKGTKGQKSRAGAGVKPGFRGGDNRLWQLFPKNRGSSHKSGGAGNNRVHRKHRYFQLRTAKGAVLNLDVLNQFSDGQEITGQTLVEKGIINRGHSPVKILGNGTISRKLSFKGFVFSASAKDKIIKAGGTINV